MRKPESLQACRASSCTPERLDKWFADYSEFVHQHGLQDKPQRIWNADESGFPLCPKTSRVLCMRNKKHVYSVHSDSKCQITTLVAASAAGSVIPPMHIFPGKRFSYNPLEGAVAGAYMGRSDNGWMVTQLFYGWLANHFVSHIPPERPVLLIVDGHSTHIDVEISKFCKENGILLYCLLPHSSHITQPLDVGFFGALKTSWGKAVDKYKISHMGSSVTKESFAAVFNTAWTGAVKMATIVNSFARAGIYPIDRSAVANSGPATLYSESTTTDSSSASSTSCDSSISKPKSGSTSGASSPLEAIENIMNPSTLRKFHKRYTEGYNVQGDELYAVWEQLKKLTLSSGEDGTSAKEKQTSTPVHEKDDGTTAQAKPVEKEGRQAQAQTSAAFSEILVYPEPITKKSKQKKNPMPPHLNSSQMIEYLSKKKQDKIDKEAETQRKRAEREAKKAEKEEQQRQKKAAREAKKAQAIAAKQRKKGATTRGRGKRAPVSKGRPVMEDGSFAESESSSTEESDKNLDVCPVCGGTEEDSDGGWVACDSCSQWYHIACAGIPQELHDEVDSLDWYCSKCSD